MPHLKASESQGAKKMEADLLVTRKKPSATTNQLLTTIKQNLGGQFFSWRLSPPNLVLYCIVD